MAGITGYIHRWTGHLLSMVYPHICEVCGGSLAEGEDMLCLDCDYSMPRCNIHNQPFNIIHQRLASHIPLERAAGYFHYYRANRYTRLIHAAKYQGRPRIARILARNFAREILPDGFFQGIDMIIPVPLHRSRLLRRGYNQSLFIARGINDITAIPIAGNLVATLPHSTQTRSNAYSRWLNSRHIYSCTDASDLHGRHILIVDDVITTGATLLACCEAIHKAAPTAKISILTLAVATLG